MKSGVGQSIPLLFFLCRSVLDEALPLFEIQLRLLGARGQMPVRLHGKRTPFRLPFICLSSQGSRLRISFVQLQALAARGHKLICLQGSRTTLQSADLVLVAAGRAPSAFRDPAATARLSVISRPACVAKSATSEVRLMPAKSRQQLPLIFFSFFLF